jgi:hypothetical protein
MIIGFAGKKGAGKDYVAGMFQQELHKHKITTKRIAFADSLKDGLSAMLCIPKYFLYSDDKETHGYNIKTGLVSLLEKDPEAISIRKLMQNFGQCFKSFMGDNIWVNLAMNKIIDNAIITDVRFPNEVAAIKNRGGYIIRIINPNEQANDQDISENALNDYKADFEIINDKAEGSYENEQAQIEDIIDIILNDKENKQNSSEL